MCPEGDPLFVVGIMISKETTGNSDERELVITRIIDAPRQRVFKASTTQLPERWGAAA